MLLLPAIRNSNALFSSPNTVLKIHANEYLMDLQIRGNTMVIATFDSRGSEPNASRRGWYASEELRAVNMRTAWVTRGGVIGIHSCPADSRREIVWDMVRTTAGEEIVKVSST